MNLIPTTATAAEKLKRVAKKQRTSGISLAAALDAAAIAAGYTGWKHVTECVEGKKSMRPADRPLPPHMAEHLRKASERRPIAPDVRAAFDSGLVFAFDVKELEGVEIGDDLVDCDDAWHRAAQDLWRAFAFNREDEESAAYFSKLTSDQVLEKAQDYLLDFRLLRYVSETVPATLEDAFERVFSRFFFAPSHVWLNGRFVEMSDVPEVRVNGRVVFSTQGSSMQSAEEGARPLPAREAATAARLASQAVAGPSAGVIANLDVRKLEPGLYEYVAYVQNQELFRDAGFQCIREALAEAAEIEGDIDGYEVRYGGLSVGTYPLASLRSDAEGIADLAVRTVAALGDHGQRV